MKKLLLLFAAIVMMLMSSTPTRADVWTTLPTECWVHGDNVIPHKLTDENGVYEVHVRSLEQAQAAGNASMYEGKLAVWDTQFSITFGEENALKNGDVMSVTFKVKSDHTASFGTQSDKSPCDFFYWDCIGQVESTTSWTNVTREVKVTDEMDGMYSITFNLADGQENYAYFKDIVVKVKHANDNESWTDLISLGELVNGSGSCFYTRVYPANQASLATVNDGVIVIEAPARVNNGWDTEFYIRLPQILPAGTPFRISFECRASVNVNIETQSFEEPGHYVHYEAIGGVGFTTSWHTFLKETTVSEYCDDNHSFRSIGFILAKESPVTYYIKNIKVEIPSDAVTVVYDPKVYTEFDEATGTLTYYYDSQMASRPGITEAYDPVNNPDAVRFTGYYKKVLKAVIDPSMKNANLTSMYSMFFGGIHNETFAFQALSKMTEIKGMENLNTANVTRMDWMFEACNALKTIDVNSFDISKVTEMDFMFGDCYELTTIYCSKDWSSTSASSDNMFGACRKLVGGNGTAFDSNVTNATYARPDGGTASPGYFTAGVVGDVNGDKVVNFTDAQSILTLMANENYESSADVNNDDAVNFTDYQSILTIMAQ